MSHKFQRGINQVEKIVKQWFLPIGILRIYIKCRKYFWLSLQTWHLKTLNGLSILLTSFFLIFKLPVLPLLWSYIDEELLWHQFWISSVRPYKLTFYALLSHMCIYIPEGATCFCHFIRFPFLIFFCECMFTYSLRNMVLKLRLFEIMNATFS